MAEHRRQRHGIVLVAHDQVGMAQAGGDYAHQHFIVLRPTDARLLDRERLFFFAHHGHGDIAQFCCCGHEGLLDQIG